MPPSTIKVKDKNYPIEYKKARGRTSSVRIRQGKVIIRLSRFSQSFQTKKTIQKFLKWAGQKLEQASANELVMPTYQDGGRICTHNKIYELTVIKEKRKASHTKLVNGFQIELRIPETATNAKIKDFTEKAIMKDQTPYLEQVLSELNQLHFQEDYNLCRFKRNSSRFGSCSNKRNINISYSLLFAPREVFQYVCIHELAHLKEFNHSKKFWQLVEQAMPNYKEHEKWLKEKGFLLG